MCLTDVPENRIPIEKLAGYKDEDYEILFRAIAAGQEPPFFNSAWMPNRKTDSNNRSGIFTDSIGYNYDYPEADYAGRERIAEAHENWQRGLLWTSQNHPRVPEKIRAAHAQSRTPRGGEADPRRCRRGHVPARLLPVAPPDPQPPSAPRALVRSRQGCSHQNRIEMTCEHPSVQLLCSIPLLK